jgi:hypothetical protein
MIGALQVAALRLGHTPSRAEWERLRLKPTTVIYQERFGSWAGGVRAAGLPVNTRLSDRAKCLASVRFAAVFLGRRPTATDYRSDLTLREALRKELLPTSSSSIKKHCGSWSAALKDAFPS